MGGSYKILVTIKRKICDKSVSSFIFCFPPSDFQIKTSFCLLKLNLGQLGFGGSLGLRYTSKFKKILQKYLQVAHQQDSLISVVEFEFTSLQYIILILTKWTNFCWHQDLFSSLNIYYLNILCILLWKRNQNIYSHIAFYNMDWQLISNFSFVWVNCFTKMDSLRIK